MAYSNQRGASYDIDATASGGVNEDWSLTTDDSPFDLTGYTITCVVKDDESAPAGYGYLSQSDVIYTMTITNAASGMFDFILPPSAFSGKEGGEVSYELLETDPDSNVSVLASGFIRLLERG